MEKSSKFESPQEEQEDSGVAREEKGPETIPTMEGVRSVFEQLVEDGDYEDIRAMEDGNGLYLWDIKVGEGTEYTYMRKGTYEQGSASATKIYVTFFDGDMPVGGHDVAEYIDGEWKVY